MCACSEFAKLFQRNLSKIAIRENLALYGIYILQVIKNWTVGRPGNEVMSAVCLFVNVAVFNGCTALLLYAIVVV